MTTPSASSGGAQSGEPFYLSAIDLFARVTLGYFVIIGVAVVIDLVREDGLTFRSWTSFALQAAAAFLVALIVARRTLGRWQEAGRLFVPPNISSAAVIIALSVATGTLVGGFFPDAVGYQRRAPEPFWRTMSALAPLAIAVYMVLRPAEKTRPKTTLSQQPQQSGQPLTGETREAALAALEIFDRGEQAIAQFHQDLIAGKFTSGADAEALWAKLDGPRYVARLRQMPPEHVITTALRDAAVAQTDAVYLIALAHGAHEAMGHTVESAHELVGEVAARRGRPGAGAETLLKVARTACKEHRDTAAGLLHASRFSTPNV